MTIISIPETPSDDNHARVLELPDGFDWQDELTDKLYGPFPTFLEAVEDMQASDEEIYGEGESLGEAESEIGMAEWIDPETGEPAEDSQPRRDSE